MPNTIEAMPLKLDVTAGQVYDIADALRIAAGIYEAQAHRREADPTKSRRKKPDRDSLKRAERYRALADRLAV